MDDLCGFDHPVESSCLARRRARRSRGVCKETRNHAPLLISGTMDSPRLRGGYTADAVTPPEPAVFGRDTVSELHSTIERSHTRTQASPVFALEDGLAFMSFAAQAIVQDQFTACFQPKPRRWVDRWTPDLPLVVGSWIIRYVILFPWRMIILLGHTLLFFLMLPFVLLAGSKAGERWLFTFYCKGFVRSFGSSIRFHGEKPLLKNRPSLFVSNHTSFIDFLVLSSHEFPHAVIMQKQGGLMGWFQKYILRLNGSLVFERKIKNDRIALVKKMREHVYDPGRSPLLIFPEGTCVSNEATVLFHKGAFEYDGAYVCPVAIKYDKTRLDPYWHTREQTFVSHILYLMTRWGLDADVWYLPPTTRRANESVTDFAYRVKTDISNRAGLKNLSWDGYMKHGGPAREKREKLMETGQQTMGEGIKRRFQAQYTRQKLMRRLKRSQSFGSLRDFAQPSSKGVLGAEELADAEGMGEDVDMRNQALIAREEFGITSGAVVVAQVGKVIDTWRNYSRLSQRFGDANSRRTEYWSWRVWYRDRKLHQQMMEERARKAQDPLEMLKRVPSGLLGFVGGVLGGGRKRTPSGSNRLSDMTKLSGLDGDRPREDEDRRTVSSTVRTGSSTVRQRDPAPAADPDDRSPRLSSGVPHRSTEATRPRVVKAV
ncbi:hypothetical protein DFJ74DRAFT_28971 [Hyaloraphidium curvatum]|nr:hypothetical protein DFJ74DRAFT_28971 [Hyaloraphidium curvatum]